WNGAAGASRSSTWTESASTRCSRPALKSKVICQPKLEKIDSGIGVREAAVGKMLQAHARVIAILWAVAHAEAQVVAILEVGAEEAPLVDAQVREQVKADRALHIRRDGGTLRALQAEYRRK